MSYYPDWIDMIFRKLGFKAHHECISIYNDSEVYAALTKMLSFYTGQKNHINIRH